ncbi:acyltransferase family protein [Granulicella arctica]|uniref:acyltransferase family protein n=1 Tax=Granulicella arctica TaxID=940613 RepID=UPI0021DFE861|nr:acyltransferase [Granulicella arctica]
MLRLLSDFLPILIPAMPTAPRLPGLDTLRSLAILAVMLFHLQGVLPESFHPVARFGWMGVDLFFVLSGYLIGLQLLRPVTRGEQPSLRDFYRRRAYRILPAYLVVVTLYVLVPLWRESPGISPLWQFLTFTENLFVDYSIHQAFSHIWSLCVEEHFYLILPVLVIALMRRPSFWKTAAALAFVLLIGIATRSYGLIHTLRPLGEDNFSLAYIEHIYYPTWTRLDGLLAGVILALMQSFRPAWWSAVTRRGHLTFGAGLALFALSLWLFANRFSSLTGAAAWGTVIGFPILSLAFALLVASGVSRNGYLSRLRIPGAQTVATLAFGLYLIHKEIVHLDQHVFPNLTADPNAKATLLYAVTCLLAAALLHLSVERPFMQLRDHRSARRTEEQMRTEPAL